MLSMLMHTCKQSALKMARYLRNLENEVQDDFTAQKYKKRRKFYQTEIETAEIHLAFKISHSPELEKSLKEISQCCIELHEKSKLGIIPQYQWEDFVKFVAGYVTAFAGLSGTFIDKAFYIALQEKTDELLQNV